MQILNSFHRHEKAPLTSKFLAKYNLHTYEYYNFTKGKDDEKIDDVSNFEMTLQCMKNVAITEEELTQILDVMIAILNLGNVKFEGEEGDELLPTANSSIHISEAAKLLQVDKEGLIKSLTVKQ